MAVSPDVQAMLDDYDAYDTSPGFTNDCTAHKALLTDFPLITKAVRWASHTTAMRDTFWVAIDGQATYAPQAGWGYQPGEPASYTAIDPFELVPPAAGPYLLQLSLTAVETRQSYAAKVAWAVDAEVDRYYPWRITRYTEEELGFLIGPDWVYPYTTFDWGGTDVSKLTHFLDYAPHEVAPWAELKTAGATSPRHAIDLIIRNWGSDFVHFEGGGVDAQWIVDHDDSKVLQGGDLVSRAGCHSMSLLLVGWARGLNIPAYYISSHYYGGAHGTALFPTCNLVVAHGDHIYSNAFAFTTGQPGTTVCYTYDHWRDNILPLDTFADRNNATHRDDYLRFAERPSLGHQNIFKNVPTQGWAYFVTYFDPWLDDAEMHALYSDLVALTGFDGGVTESGYAP